MIILVGLVVITFTLVIRLVPLWRSRARGCDAYYYLLCVEEFKRHKRLPVVLPPYFRMDTQEQYYPPGFILFLSVFPMGWLKRNYWLITPVLDSVIAYLVYDTAVWVSGNVWTGLLAGVIYALTYPAFAETSNLNSRPLGSLLLAGMMLCTFQAAYGSWLWLSAAILFGFAVIMTHKMTTQLMLVLLPAMSVALWSPDYIIVLMGSFALAMVIGREFTLKMLEAHADILQFWNRNWHNLGAHQVYTSPIYGNESRQDNGRVFQNGLRGFLNNIKYAGANVFVLLLIFPILRYAGLGPLWGDNPLALFDRQLLWWAILTYVLAGAALFVPLLRFYGEGYKYLRMAALPVAVLAARSFGYGGWHNLVLGICLMLSLVVIAWRTNRSLRSTVNPVIDADFVKALDYLKGDKVKVVLSMPTHLADAVVYYARKPVVWGTHSDNFKEVEPFFPVMRKSLEWFIEKYGVTHVLLRNGYVMAHEVGLVDGSEGIRSGLYMVYKVGEK
ncbi:MAG: hypothetical protein PHQ43_04310 [Dehalococcoidales bacterium]|nr:hypothetical protein [Dehalococcoidales bacterium]